MNQHRRVPFAAGDYLTRYSKEETYAFRIDAPFEKPGWQARTFSPAGQVLFPGSTVSFEGKLYEIAFQDYDAGPPLSVRYYLTLWDERFPIRSQFHYNKAECVRTARLYRNRLATNRHRVLWTFCSPLLGMLPGEDQIRIANQYGMQATRMTYFSALLLLPLAGFAILYLALNIIYGIPLPGPVWLQWLYPGGFYLFAESLLRMLTAAKLEEPIGSLPVSLPILVGRAIQQIWDPTARQKALENLRPIDESDRDRLMTAMDQVLPSEDAEHLEILSILPKPHWTPRVAIGVNGTWYGLVKSEMLRNGKSNLYRYLLKRAPEGTWFAKVVEYAPDEVQLLYREKRLQELKTWVDTFAFLWGLLSREEQIRLEELYEYDSLKFTRISVISLSVLAFANLIVSVINLAGGVATSLDIWLLLIAGFFLLENFSRWRDCQSGQPSGSVLGLFVRPFARKILAGV